MDTLFCLPWLITWFAHTLSDYRYVVRLYDFFLASPELMPMYIATAIVLQKEEELLAEKDQEVCAIFSILSKVGRCLIISCVFTVFLLSVLAFVLRICSKFDCL